MKNTVLLLIIVVIQAQLFGQATGDTELIIKLADDIIENTSYTFINKNTKEVFSEPTPAIAVKDMRLSSPYTDWKYWNGVLNLGLLKLSSFTGNPKYRETVLKNYAFAFRHKDFFTEYYPANENRWNHPFGLFTRIDQLDDCGAMGAGLLEIADAEKKEVYEKYIREAADHMLHRQDRLDDGTLVRGAPYEYTLWADDLYMSIVFLSRMGSRSGDMRYFEDAARQVLLFTEHLFQKEKQLYYHCYYSEEKRNGVAHWGRSNGWVMMAQAELLDHLPLDHPKRDTLISIFEQQIIGASRYQTASGLWRQLLNKEDSYLETSVTAMFTYSIAKGINEGWIDKRYRSIAENSWAGIKTRINADGKVEGICQGTSIDESLSYYYNRPTPLHDIHGLGAVLLAGIEMLRLSGD